MKQEDLDFIKENYKLGPTQLSKMIPYTSSTIGYYCKKLGLPSTSNRLNLKESDAEFIRNNYLDMSYSEIGSFIGLTAKQVNGWIANHIPDHKRKRREFDKRYFEHIDTPDKAYWLGFIYADGWITKHKRSGSHNSEYSTYEFGIELQRQDGYMLERLNAALGGSHQVTEYTKSAHTASGVGKYFCASDMSKLRVYSKDIVNDLHINGIDFNKSQTGVFPIVDDDYFLDFLRGYIDGDGCIYIMSNEKNILGVQITSSSDSILNYINETLERLYGITTSIYHESERKHRIFWFASEKVKRLLDLIYQDPNCEKLERKYEIYKNFYGLAS